MFIKKYVMLCQPYLIIYDSNTDSTERDIIALNRAEIAYDEALTPGVPVRDGRDGRARRASIRLPSPCVGPLNAP